MCKEDQDRQRQKEERAKVTVKVTIEKMAKDDTQNKQELTDKINEMKKEQRTLKITAKEYNI